MNENIQLAVEALQAAKTEASQHLVNETGLALRVDNTLEKLINNLKHVGGFGVSEESVSTSVVQKAKTFMGVDLEALDQEAAPAKVEVDQDEQDLFVEKVKDLYYTFLDRETKDISESIKKDELIGVAKLAGITLENPSTQNITQKFINEVKDAIQAQKNLEAEKLAKKNELANAAQSNTPVVEGSDDKTKS